MHLSLVRDSSASCSNYALCMTAVKNEIVFKKATTSAFHQNFYVDY